MLTLHAYNHTIIAYMLHIRYTYITHTHTHTHTHTNIAYTSHIGVFPINCMHTYVYITYTSLHINCAHHCIYHIYIGII